MLNIDASLNSFVEQGRRALREVLRESPTVQNIVFHDEVRERHPNALDMVVSVKVGQQFRDEMSFQLLVELLGTPLPRFIKSSVSYLSEQRKVHQGLPLLIAPYLSLAAKKYLKEQEINYLDLSGNARLLTSYIFMERTVPGRPAAEKRDLKSLYRPRSAQVLRMLLRHPGRIWTGKELAELTGVSAGHVSNVRNALLNREWADETTGGWQLTQSDQLLDGWQDVYEPIAEYGRYYTAKRPNELLKLVRDIAHRRLSIDPAVIFASFSAAEQLAPYARTGTQYLYCADKEIIDDLVQFLGLSPNKSGGNISISIPADEGIFKDAIRQPDGLAYTSAVLTYLDLSVAGERGKEAAQHLRKEKLAW